MHGRGIFFKVTLSILIGKIFPRVIHVEGIHSDNDFVCSTGDPPVLSTPEGKHSHDYHGNDHDCTHTGTRDDGDSSIRSTIGSGTLDHNKVRFVNPQILDTFCCCSLLNPAPHIRFVLKLFLGCVRVLKRSKSHLLNTTVLSEPTQHRTPRQSTATYAPASRATSFSK